MGAHKIVVEIKGSREDQQEVLFACLAEMELEEIGKAFQDLHTERLSEVARKLHGAIYKRLTGDCS